MLCGSFIDGARTLWKADDRLYAACKAAADERMSQLPAVVELPEDDADDTDELRLVRAVDTLSFDERRAFDVLVALHLGAPSLINFLQQIPDPAGQAAQCTPEKEWRAFLQDDMTERELEKVAKKREKVTCCAAPRSDMRPYTRTDPSPRAPSSCCPHALPRRPSSRAWRTG